jgi:hypothetical protein
MNHHTLSDRSTSAGTQTYPTHQLPFLKLFGLCLGAAAIAVSAQAQFFQWTVESGGNGHFYEPVAAGAPLTWTDAQTAASNAGGYLATTTSQAENLFVFSLVDQASFWRQDTANGALVGPWLGGYQPAGSPEPAGGWTWLNGDGAFTYTAWGVNQPDNFGPGEDKLHYHVTGISSPRAATWNDAGDTDYPASYVIEFNVAPVPEPAAMAVVAGLALGAFAFVRLRSNRK